MFACFTQVHTNAYNFVTDAPIYKCYIQGIIIIGAWSFDINHAKCGEVTYNHKHAYNILNI